MIIRNGALGYASVLDASGRDVLLTSQRQAADRRRTLVSALANNCDTLDVCGDIKMVCARDETDKDLSQLNSQGDMMYPLFSCDTPRDSPCEPLRRADRFGDSSAYTGVPSADDQDGDGIANAQDNCPNLFNPIRPMHGERNRTSTAMVSAMRAIPALRSGRAPCPDTRDRDGDGVGTTKITALIACADQAGGR